jgi:hypothetical protein
MRNNALEDKVPGPGQYDIPSTISHVASYAMTKSMSSKYVTK